MSIKARNAHFTNWAKVVAALADKGVTDESTARAFLANSENNPFYYMVCFIKDSKELYTHGQFYNCSEYDDTELRDLISALTQEVADNEFVTATTLTILENNKADKTEFETLKKEVEENEFVTAEALTSLENNKAEKSDIPDVSKFVNVEDLHKIATSGSYNDLKNKPEIIGENDIANFGFIKGVTVAGETSPVTNNVVEIQEAAPHRYGVVKIKDLVDLNDTTSVPTMKALSSLAGSIRAGVAGPYYTTNNGVITIPDSSHNGPGLVVLSDSVTIGSSSSAATSYAVKQAYDLANSYKGTVTGVKLNGTTKSPSSGTVDLGNIPTSIKLNGTTKTPSNGVVDLGNVATTEYADTNFVKKLGQDEEITINNSCNNGDCTTNLSLKCVSDDSKFKLESWHLGDFSKISGDCRGNLDFTAATHVGDECELVTSTLSLRHDSLKWNDKQLATEEYVDSKLDSVETLVPITHSELKTLRDNSQLIPGTFYRITDYECTTTQADSRSVNHSFDIIVQALDESTLSENAQAIQHEGDEYFANAKLEAWQLKYILDNDASRFAWAKEKIEEQPAKWSCNWGVLEERYDDGAPTNYTTATIDGVQKYLYRPSQPTSYLEGKTFYRDVVVGSITSTEGFIYESDNAPENYGDSENEDWYWDDVYEIRVKTSDGQLVATLSNYGSGDFIDYEYDESGDYYISFSPNAEWDEENEVYRYTPISGVDDWFESARGGTVNEYSREYYNGSVNSLYYACSSILGESTTQIRIVTDKVHLYEYEDTIIDTVTYEAYVAPRESGKGVIYRLIDEHNNDCPFDFKNTQFLHNGEWYYTFSHYGVDASLGNNCFDNYLEIVQDQITESVTLAAAMPMLVFNWIRGASGALRGIIKNNVRTPIKKGFVQACRIDANTWTPTTGGRSGDFGKLYIYTTGQVYANIFQGHAMKFTAGTVDNPNVNFYANIFKLSILSNNDVTIDCNRFASNTVDIRNGGIGDKKIKGGDFLNCYFDDYGAAKEAGDVNLVFEANLAIANSYFRIFDALTINYENTTSSTTPLRFLNIDARGWDRGTSITIPSTFPVNAGYELKVAKNSKGEIKMWCEADLIA